MNANEPAFPSIDVEYQQGLPTTIYHHGLSKRELFAAMAMQGLNACPAVNATCEQIAASSVAYADALIKSLSEEKK